MGNVRDSVRNPDPNDMVRNASLESSDASMYPKYRYIVFISIYRIVSCRPPQYRFFSTYRHAQFSVLGGRFYITIDSNAGNKEFSYDNLNSRD